jgi:hypothetical protein
MFLELLLYFIVGVIVIFIVFVVTFMIQLVLNVAINIIRKIKFPKFKITEEYDSNFFFFFLLMYRTKLCHHGNKSVFTKHKCSKQLILTSVNTP